jgi:outer membrane lipoprotein-sorting protein
MKKWADMVVARPDMTIAPSRTAAAFTALALCLAWSPAALAEESAQEIARKARDRGSLNLKDLTAELRLTTRRGDKTKEQVLRTTSREVGGRAHSVARFLAPAGVAGVGVLTVEGEGDEPDDITLYLPKLKRTRKVAKTQRGQSFMDTDFSYADLGGVGGEEKRIKRLADGTVDGRAVYVLEGQGDKESPYGKVTLHVDKETYVPLRVEYQDKEGKPFKEYRTLKLRKFKDRVLAAESSMRNLQTGSETKMELLKLEDATLGDEDFTERALERG